MHSLAWVPESLSPQGLRSHILEVPSRLSSKISTELSTVFITVESPLLVFGCPSNFRVCHLSALLCPRSHTTFQDYVTTTRKVSSCTAHFCVNLTQELRSSEKWDPPLREARRQVWGALIPDWCGSALLTVGCATPGQVVMGSIRQQTEQTLENKPGSSILLWSLLEC